MLSKKLLVFVAINEEFKVVKKLLKMKAKSTDKKPMSFCGESSGYGVDLVMTSMGMDWALKCAEEKINPETYGGVLVIGYCGGLSLTLHNSDVVVPNKVISSRDGFVYKMNEDLVEEIGKIIIGEGLKYRAVPLITEKSVIETPDEKHELFKRSNAEAVDMETSEILRVAEKRGVRASAFKVVIDDVETELPSFNEIFKKTGRMDQLSIASAMMSSPGLSMRLSANMKQASHVIDSILPKVIQKLCEEWQISKV